MPQAPRQHPEVDMPKHKPRRRVSVTHSPTSHAPEQGTHSPSPVTSKTYTSLGSVRRRRRVDGVHVRPRTARFSTVSWPPRDCAKLTHAHEQNKVARSRSLLGESEPIQLVRPQETGFAAEVKLGEQRIAIGFRWLSTSFTALINSADHRASAPLHSCIDYPDSTAAAQLHRCITGA